MTKRRILHSDKKVTNNLEAQMKGVGVRETKNTYEIYIRHHNRMCRNLGHEWVEVSSIVVICARCGKVKSNVD